MRLQNAGITTGVPYRCSSWYDIYGVINCDLHVCQPVIALQAYSDDARTTITTTATDDSTSTIATTATDDYNDNMIVVVFLLLSLMLILILIPILIQILLLILILMLD